MKNLFMFTALVTLGISGSAFADHRIEQLEGRWFSTLWPNGTEYYEFSGIRAEGEQYLFQQTRNAAGGLCLGTGMIDLHSGKVLSIEVCPARDGRERVFLNEWTIEVDHDDYHLRGGYYNKGSSEFKAENLDKDLHHNESIDNEQIK